MKQAQKNFLAGVVGNILDRYDIALYGFMASFIAPNFFPGDDLFVATIKAYGLMAIGLITKPIGSLLFGYLAMTIGPKKVMIISLIGISFTTCMMGLVPSHAQIGHISTLLFVLVRVCQSMFAVGEHVVAPFFIIENSTDRKYTRSSGFYHFSTMFGVVMASIASAIVSKTSDPQFYWRYAYFLGSFTALAGLYLRLNVINEAKELKIQISFKEVRTLIYDNKYPILRVGLVASFSYITYTIPFIFMNSFIPQITNIDISEMLQLNSMLLVLDTTLIPIFTLISERYDIRKFMATMSLTMVVCVLPLFAFLQDASFMYVMFVRLFIILVGLAYLAPIHAWYYSLFKSSDRYLLIGIGAGIGDEILGKNSTAICLFLWHYFQTPIAPACYIFTVASLASFALIAMEDKKKPKYNIEEETELEVEGEIGIFAHK
ncbi:MAG: MFS transporter [Rickettsiaceae bacterium]|nr:MFS transporter [Rickettsiaceae bacterium]